MAAVFAKRVVLSTNPVIRKLLVSRCRFSARVDFVDGLQVQLFTWLVASGGRSAGFVCALRPSNRDDSHL